MSRGSWSQPAVRTYSQRAGRREAYLDVKHWTELQLHDSNEKPRPLCYRSMQLLWK